ncbi:sugar ABC transporter ATP-binding protein [Caproiciproducens sp. NJN-50]|uniref:sugar ABC transporter ATP-binding protein n=1 Tax=Caproiciproducens sp. NJN-50 TaxID=2507162 RepID=UPI000FFE06B8|nr:sugar ABC transporter ATP-binding protein [Caproiciproducens sp. NJN-50]QAT48984.1 sugar ABC transporter ATP-binding protein [Caproiciproducens sp. NJN-50]
MAENIFVGLLPKSKRGMVDWKAMNKAAGEELAGYGLDISPAEMVRNLRSIDVRKLNIIRAMHKGAKLIILDEPTTALTNRERDELFAFIRKLKEGGIAFIFISHYLGEVKELSDEITVLRDGCMYPVENPKEVTEEYLSRLVAGEKVQLTQRQNKTDFEDENKLFECRHLTAKGLDDVSVDIYRGEILGIIGFPGSGAREMCRTLFGANKLSKGEILYLGKKLSIKSPKEAIRNGLAYVSYDRQREGLIPQFTVNYNIGMSVLHSKLKKPFGFINMKKEREISDHYKDVLNLKCNGIDDPISSLSGGNQQKVVVGRALAAEPKLLVLDEPTIGIDIKSREEIIATIDKMTQSGVSVLYLTNDYEELLRVADRLIFFKDSKIVAQMDNKDLDVVRVTEIRDHAKGEI